jgi:hypothetical protein
MEGVGKQRLLDRIRL